MARLRFKELDKVLRHFAFLTGLDEEIQIIGIARARTDEPQLPPNSAQTPFLLHIERRDTNEFASLPRAQHKQRPTGAIGLPPSFTPLPRQKDGVTATFREQPVPFIAQCAQVVQGRMEYNFHRATPDTCLRCHNSSMKKTQSKSPKYGPSSRSRFEISFSMNGFRKYP